VPYEGDEPDTKRSTARQVHISNRPSRESENKRRLECKRRNGWGKTKQNPQRWARMSLAWAVKPERSSSQRRARSARPKQNSTDITKITRDCGANSATRKNISQRAGVRRIRYPPRACSVQNLLPCAESVIREGNGQGEIGVPVHSSARGDSKSVPKNSAGISQSCGSSEELPLISDSQMDLAWAYFWGKRKMTPPTVSSGGIMPSVSDFDDELSILQMRATI
jgi:hypothetical protein